jgi:hypothetical protein
VTIAGGLGHHAVKKLAYDLCKSVPLLPSDLSLLVDGIKVCGVWVGAQQSSLAAGFLEGGG